MNRETTSARHNVSGGIVRDEESWTLHLGTSTFPLLFYFDSVGLTRKQERVKGMRNRPMEDNFHHQFPLKIMNHVHFLLTPVSKFPCISVHFLQFIRNLITKKAKNTLCWMIELMHREKMITHPCTYKLTNTLPSNLHT